MDRRVTIVTITTGLGSIGWVNVSFPLLKNIYIYIYVCATYVSPARVSKAIYNTLEIVRVFSGSILFCKGRLGTR